MPDFDEPDPLNPEGVDEPGYVPDWYTRGCQVRQFGIGGASTLGHPPNISTGLAFPPAEMSVGDSKLRSGVVVVEAKAALYDFRDKGQGDLVSPNSELRDETRDNSLGTDIIDPVESGVQEQ